MSQPAGFLSEVGSLWTDARNVTLITGALVIAVVAGAIWLAWPLLRGKSA